jgi:hypothetical protein
MFYAESRAGASRGHRSVPEVRRISLLVSQSANANGRQPGDGIYQGGSARIYLLEFSGAMPAASETSS